MKRFLRRSLSILLGLCLLSTSVFAEELPQGDTSAPQTEINEEVPEETQQKLPPMKLGAPSVEPDATVANANALKNAINGGKKTILVTSSISLSAQLVLKADTYIYATADNISLTGKNTFQLINAGKYNLTLENLTLTRGANTGTGKMYGGAIIATSGDVTLTNCTIKSCKSKQGGAVYVETGALTITGCTFESNSLSVSSAKGGAIYYEGVATKPLVIKDSTFKSNSATGDGGAIYSKNSPMQLTNCHFIENSCKSSGGALATIDSAITIESSTFTGNTATAVGGAILDNNGPITLKDVQFSQNKANILAGAVFKDAGSLTATGCTFDQNTTTCGGGAIYMSGSIEIDDCTFTKNTSTTSDTTCNGGALSFGWGTAQKCVIKNSAFTQNGSAFKGGAVYIHQGSATISNCLFEGNTATNDGAGVYTAGKLLTVDTNCRFIKNSNTSSGAAIATTAATLVVKDSEFTENYATAVGGAILDNTGVLDISNCAFTGNHTNIIGGALFKDDGDLHLADCTFVGNYTVGGGGVVFTSGNVDMERVTLNGNYATEANGGAILENASGGRTVKGHLIFSEGNSALNGSVVYANGGTVEIDGYSTKNNTEAPFAAPTGTLKLTNRLNVATTEEELKAMLVEGVSPITVTKPIELTETIVITADTVLQASTRETTLSGNGTFRLIDAGAKNLTLKNITLTKGQADNGGAVSVSGGKLTLDSVTLKDNAATAEGGAIYVTSGEVVAGNNVMFESNTAAQNGAAIANDDGKVTLNDTTFAHNQSAGTGACYYGHKGELHAKDILTNQNSPSTEMFFTEDGTMELINVCGVVITYAELKDFIDQGAPQIFVGAAIELPGTLHLTADLELVGQGSVAALIGDGTFGLINTDNHNLTVRSLTLKNGGAIGTNGDYVGGAIFSDAGDVTLDEVALSNNKAVNGGAVQVNSGNLTVLNSVFDHNICTGDGCKGGAIFYEGAPGKTLCVTSSSFEYNTSPGDGGAIYTNQSPAVITDTTFIGNSASNSSGGAIATSNQKIEVTGCHFEDNSASAVGGAILDNTGELEIRDSKFLNHSTNIIGGAIFKDSGMLKVSGCEFCGNTAPGGGGAIFTNGDFVAQKTVFGENTASAAAGGAVYVGGSIATADACVFRGNSAAADGTCLYATTANVQVKDSCVNHNLAGKKEFASGTGTVTEKDNFQAYTLYEEIAAALAAKESEIKIYGVIEMQGILNLSADAKLIGLGDEATLDGDETKQLITAYGYHLTLENLTLRDGAANGQEDRYVGGAVFCDTGDLTATDCRFINNSAINGGAIQANSGKLMLTRCSFIGNKTTGEAVRGGAVFYDGTAKMVVSDCLFQDSEVDGDGGALYATKADITIQNSRFLNNKATASGGAVVSPVGHIYLFGSEFDGNAALAVAGAVLANNGGLEITSCTFANNKADMLGGVAHQDTGNLTVIDSVIEGNTAGQNGAGFFFDSPATNKAVIKGTIFKNNTSTLDGAGIYLKNAPVEVSDSEFTGNTVTGGSGAGIASPVGSVTVTGTTFSKNHAAAVGGAICANNGAIYLKGCTVSENTSNIIAGAIHTDNSEVTFEDSTFTGNNVLNDGSLGGVMFFGSPVGTVMKIKNCTFMYNESGAEGAGIYAPMGGYDVSGSTFRFNKSRTGSGAALTTVKGDITANNCVFDDNSAAVGGALLANDGSIYIYNSSVCRNTSQIISGALHTDNGNVIIANSTLNDNICYGSLGGVFFNNSPANREIKLTKVTMNNNSARDSGGAIYINSDIPMTITDSEISGNTSGVAGGALCGTNGPITVVNSTLNNNESGIVGGAIFNKNNKVTLQKVVMNDNFIYDSGAVVFIETGDLEVKDSEFNGNIATSMGGVFTLCAGNAAIDGCTFKDGGSGVCAGLLQHTGSAYTITFTNCDVENIRAVGDAGAVLATGSKVICQNCNFKNIVSGGIGGVFNVGTLDLDTCTFEGSKSAETGDIAYVFSILTTKNLTFVGELSQTRPTFALAGAGTMNNIDEETLAKLPENGVHVYDAEVQSESDQPHGLSKKDKGDKQEEQPEVNWTMIIVIAAAAFVVIAVAVTAIVLTNKKKKGVKANSEGGQKNA